MAAQPNYHISLWPEPPGPPTYLCLLCAVTDATEAEILVHISTIHAVTPVPTPLAADTTLVPALRTQEVPDASASPDILDRDD